MSSYTEHVSDNLARCTWLDKELLKRMGKQRRAFHSIHHVLLSDDQAGINVNAIAPGYIETEMNTALIGDPNRSRQILERIPLQRWGSPDDFEGLIIFLCSSASDYLSGECIACDGGWMGR